MTKLKTLTEMMNDDSVLKELVEKLVMDAYIRGLEEGAQKAQKEKDEYILELESQICNCGP